MKTAHPARARAASDTRQPGLYVWVFILLMAAGISTAWSQTYDPLSSRAGRVSTASTDSADSVVPEEVSRVLGDVQLQGHKRFRWLGFSVYDIRLWVEVPLLAEQWADRPFALELVYARSLKGEAIAERSLKEMASQQSVDPGQQANWLSFMQSAFPNVSDGDRLTGIYRPDGGATFYFNGRETASTRDTDFARLFFGIWLSSDTSEPAMRRALFGITE